MGKSQTHERRLRVDRRIDCIDDRRKMIRFEPDKEPRRSGIDRRGAGSWEKQQRLA
ncbi:MAG: hypothetical protein AAGB35_06205 [Pseudomonadota bacterium]